MKKTVLIISSVVLNIAFILMFIFLQSDKSDEQSKIDLLKDQLYLAEQKLEKAYVADFSKDYLKIQKLALQNKQLKEIEKWQDDKINETYIKISMENRDCNFYSNWLKN